jgi:multicomponent Na+:H+ antiporter subunit E
MSRPFSNWSASSRLRDFSRGVGAFLLGLLLWRVCTGPDPLSWILGLPAAGLFAGFVLQRGEEGPHFLRIRFRALPGFFVYFLLQSFRAGIHVARHALHPLNDIHPGFTTYRSRLPEGAPRAVFANLISILPGTLSWSLEDGVHKVHLLSGHPLVFEELAQLEGRVGRLYGLKLEELF